MGDSLPENLADLEPEEVFLDALTNADFSTPGNKRRLSAAGSASRLKEKNLMPPLNTPTTRRISFPRATKCVLASTPTSQKKMPTEKPQAAAAKTALDSSAAMLDRMEAMFRGLREDIGKSEANTGKKIDDLSNKINSRLT